jgi:hypothetical protein
MHQPDIDGERLAMIENPVINQYIKNNQRGLL